MTHYIKEVKLGNDTYPIKDSEARTSISALTDRVSSLESNKHMVVIGDSHSTTINVPASSAWYTIVGQKLNLTVHNYAVGGVGYVKTVSNKNFSTEVDEAIADTSFDNDDVRVVIVYGGINDLTAENAPSLAGNCALLCDKINTNFPNAKLYIIGITTGRSNFLVVENGKNNLYYWGLMKQTCCNKAAIFINSCFWLRKGTAGTNPFYNNENNHPNLLGDQTVASNMLNAMYGYPTVLGNTNPNVCRYTATTGTGTLEISASGDYLFVTGNATLDENGVAEFTDSNYFMTNQYSPQYLTATNALSTIAIVTYNHTTHILKVAGSANQTYYFRTVVALNP